MKANLMYCEKKFKKSLGTTKKTKAIHQAFEALEIEIKKLKQIDQINLYSAATQFLDSLLQDEQDPINPLEVFILRAESIVDGNHKTLEKVVLALGVIAISLFVVAAGVALGIGIGMLAGLWLTPMVFLAALFAAKLTPILVTAGGVAAGLGAGALSQFLFFKEPKIKTTLDNCVEAIKQSHLSQMESEEGREEELDHPRMEADDRGARSPVLH